MKSKTIILSSQKKFVTNSPRAILTFIAENKNIEGKIRLYNMNNLNAGVKLGIYYNEKVYTTNLISSQGSWTFFVDEKLDLNKNIYCALIDTRKGNEVVLCGGTNSGFFFTDDIKEFNYETNDNAPEYEDYDAKLENIQAVPENKQTNDYNTANSTISTDKCNFEGQEHNEDKEREVKQEENSCNDCKNCTYKDYFYSHYNKDNKVNEQNINSIEIADQNLLNSIIDNECTNNINKENSSNIQEITKQTIDTDSVQNTDAILSDNAEKFLSSITEQLDEMFRAYPIDEELMSIIPNSKIVKVYDSVDESTYIVGIIYENDEIKYLLYGVPSKYNEKAPQELGENYQWLPIDLNDPMSDGYFIIYQDAQSGKLVPIKVE